MAWTANRHLVTTAGNLRDIVAVNPALLVRLLRSQAIYALHKNPFFGVITEQRSEVVPTLRSV